MSMSTATNVRVRTHQFIGGTWRASTDTAVTPIVSPSTEETFGLAPSGTLADVDAAVAAARAALTNPTWRDASGAERATWMRALADELSRRGDDTAAAVSGENGMPISLSRVAEGQGPAATLHYYADLAEQTPPEEQRPARGGRVTVVRREPIGVVAAIIPWNFPQSLTMFKVAPALAAGCTLVIKPAPETALDVFALADAAEACGLPPGVINIVTGDREVGATWLPTPEWTRWHSPGRPTRAGPSARSVDGCCGR
jgi:aldehyde dehydrogenase (NAD+)